MTHYDNSSIFFPHLNGRKIEVNFKGGHVTSDGGALLLREIDNKLNLTKEAASFIEDPRNPDRITHSIQTMLRQRVYGIAQGYEDLNDHTELRHDIAMQTSLETDDVTSSASTLCRFEAYANRETAVKLHRLLLDRFMDSFREEPSELTLDFDATDDPVHGDQEGKFFHGYYGHYCFLPLYVFCGKQLLVSYLRPSGQDGAKHAWAILALLVKALRKRWPGVKITFRGDGGFCRHRMLDWCERNDVGYIVGLAGNKVLEKASLMTQAKAAVLYDQTNEDQRHFSEFTYQAKTWKRKRKVIVKAELNKLGSNTRYIVTNLEGEPEELYSTIYCARGNMEQSIDEQLSFYSDRTSCHEWWSNQFRLLLSSLAYVLVDTLRRVCLKGTFLEFARCATIRLKLLKIGAIIIRNTRRIAFRLAEGYPYQELFYRVYQKLCPG
jgi:hypothetical protein